jgi:hypothetical protein
MAGVRTGDPARQGGQICSMQEKAPSTPVRATIDDNQAHKVRRSSSG